MHKSSVNGRETEEGCAGVNIPLKYSGNQNGKSRFKRPQIWGQ